MIETDLIAYLSTSDVPASIAVPNPRPPRFITVRRTGGGLRQVADDPMLQILCWGTSVVDAAALAYATRDSLRVAPNSLKQVARVDIQSLTDMPDPDSGQARYQIVVQLATTIH